MVEPPPPSVIGAHPYVLSIGDTIASVALRYGVTVNDLKAANPSLDFRRLKAGDAIQVPDSARR
jgi:LysM repeat protein